MAQSLSSIVIHVIFSTKARQRVLIPEIRKDLFDYMANIAKNSASIVYEIGGVEDHVHMLVSLPRTLTLAKLVELIKKGTSKWLKQRHVALRLFSWQNGYGAFSVSTSQIPVVRKYIQQQEEHHKLKTFDSEFVAFLKLSNIPYDEKFLWN